MSKHREPCGKEGRAENEVARGYLESVGLGFLELSSRALLVQL